MDDILSKEEIEALLSREAEKETKKGGRLIRPYDFHAAKRFSKEHLRIFQILMEDFCRRLKNYLSLRSRLDLEISIQSIRQTTFKDFLSLTSPTYIAIFSLMPLEGSAAIEIDPGLLIFLIEHLLGGENREKPSRRELTPLEVETSSTLISKILSCFRDSFEKEIRLESKIESVESDPQFLVIASPNEAILLLSLEIKLQDISGTLNICLPYLVLESLIPHLSIKRWFMAQKKSTPESEETIRRHLGKIELTLVCKLGSCETTISELYNLQEGDYIRLDKSKESLLELQLAGLTKFLVQPGLIGNRVAVKIVSVAE